MDFGITKIDNVAYKEKHVFLQNFRKTQKNKNSLFKRI